MQCPPTSSSRVSINWGYELFAGGPRKPLFFAILFFIFYFDFKFGFKSTILVQNGIKFLINKHKNRGRFLFIGIPLKRSRPWFKKIRSSPHKSQCNRMYIRSTSPQPAFRVACIMVRGLCTIRWWDRTREQHPSHRDCYIANCRRLICLSRCNRPLNPFQWIVACPKPLK
jgi:hypothetical protein